MIIQHNIMALNAHRQLGGNNTLVSKNLEKLSSGFKINRAGDDAAGLAISEKMRAQITGLSRAQSNAQDGISLVQTAEGALTEVHSMLNRLVDLSTQSENGTFQAEDRQKIQDEVDALTTEIDRISQATNFNGINLLDGSLGGGTTKVDKGAAGAITTAGVTTKAAFDVTASTGAGAAADEITLTYTDETGANQTLTLTMSAGGAGADEIDVADFGIGFTNADLAAAINGASGTGVDAFKNLFTVGTDASGALTIESKVKDADVTFTAIAQNNAGGGGATFTADANKAQTGVTEVREPDTAAVTNMDFKNNFKAGMTITLGSGNDKMVLEMVKAGEAAKDPNAIAVEVGADLETTLASIVAGAAGSVGFTVAANADNTGLVITNTSATDVKPTIATKVDGGGLSLQIGDTNDAFNKVSVNVGDMSSTGLDINGLVVTEQGLSGEAIATIKAAVDTVSSARSGLGALQNRLEHTINNLGVTTENMTAAESRIRDVDMAKEMMHFTKNNVLTQAAQSMLAQANQQPQQVLQLLR